MRDETPGGEFTQDGIHEWSGGSLASALDEFNAFVDRGARGNAAEPAELIDGQAECGENFEIELRRAAAPNSSAIRKSSNDRQRSTPITNSVARA